MARDRSDTDLVLAVRSGDRDAFGELFERWFDRVHDVARNIVGSPETAADVAQDTFVAAWERLDRLDDPEAFGGWLLRIARNRALDRLEREGRSRPQDHDVVTGLHDRGARDLTGSHRALEPEAISASRDRDGLVRAAAVALGARDASVLDLHLRHGLTPAEIADELGITANNAHQLLFRMRRKLGDAIGAFVLFRRGRPACDGLATLLPSGAEFDATTLALVERHQRTCDDCTERRSALVSPEQLFSAAPILIAPALLRSRVLHHLEAAGVPTPVPSGAEPLDPADGAADTADVSDASSSGPDAVDRATTPEPDIDGPEAVATPHHLEPRSRRRSLAVVAAAAAVVVLVLAVVARPRDAANADPSTALETAVTTSIPDGSAVSDDVDPRAGVAPAAIADDTGNSSTTVAPTAPPAMSAPPASTSPPPPLPPSPAAPGNPPSAIPTTLPPPPPPPVATPTTIPPPPTTTTPAPPPAPAPQIIRLYRPAALPATTLLCNSGTGTPHRFHWTTSDATAATLTIGPRSRTVAVNGPFDACGSSGQAVTLTITGPGGSDAASTVVP